jgi:hypothetical protein
LKNPICADTADNDDIDKYSIYVVLGVKFIWTKGNNSGHQYHFRHMSFLPVNVRHSDRSDHPTLLVRLNANLNGVKHFVFVEFTVFDAL